MTISAVFVSKREEGFLSSSLASSSVVLNVVDDVDAAAAAAEVFGIAFSAPDR
eukprot:CAMPEP_0116100132 /NCGR_PEP_ID=MMETSP0327-20121206/12133_1 /TAXON_ID=44447 /ORGANISM="Pseudo-nitzschia delicatissima, Strain B596" /LENGTH=52 /DNA_ID=CAMNT_0003592045 /DNA_START=151 /DNA_END=306 /DNA_ORIENTATION=-